MPKIRDNLRRAITHDFGTKTGSDSFCSIHQHHRNNGYIINRLDALTIIIQVGENGVILRSINKPRQFIQLCEDIPFASRVRPCLKPSPKLTVGFKQVDIVAADEILRHSDNRRIQTRLAMMVPRVFRNITTKLCDLDFRLEVFLERRKQNLSQGDFQPVHQIRDRAVAIIFRKVYHLVVDEFLIRHARLKCV